MEATGAAVSHDRGAADLLLRAALLHRRAGRWADATPALERAVEVEPHLAAPWRELGLVRQRTGLRADPFYGTR